MGQAISFGLTQYDVEELRSHCGGKFSQAEIEGLYRRFRALDRGHKGFISAEEFMSIPELSINPIARRLERLFDSVNFKEFVGALAAFSSKATRDDKLHLIFTVYDVDGDGVVSADDMELMVRQLAGSSLGEDLVKAVVRRALSEAGVPESGLRFENFKRALDGSALQMEVEIPSED